MYGDAWVSRGGRRRRPRYLRPGWLILGGLALVGVGLLALNWSSSRLLRRASEAALEADRVRSRELFTQARSRPWYAGRADEGLAVVELLEGNLEAGVALLAQAREAGSDRSAFDTSRLFSFWLAEGLYPPMAVYADHLAGRDPESVEYRLWQGLASNGLGRMDEATERLTGGDLAAAADAVRRGREAFLGPPFRTPELREAYRRHLKSIENVRRSGRRAYLFDRNGRILASRKLSGEDQATEVAEGAAVPVLGCGGDGGVQAALEPRDRLNEVHLTLDLRSQRIAQEVMAGHDAAVVVLDPEGRVLAAAAGRRRLRRGERTNPLDPLTDTVALASVAKLSTLAAALQNPLVMQDVFPLDCKGPIRVGGRPFYDWLAHGPIQDHREALARSCNIAFAKLGLEMGADTLLATLRSLGFGRPLEAAATPLSLGRLDLDTGNQRAVAGLGAGSLELRVPLAHAAAIALAVGREGEFRHPFLIASRRALGGHVYQSTEPWGWRSLPQAAARELARSMRESVEHPKGTSARVAVPGIPVAAKTGTWGGQRQGYEALVVGFAPADAPEHAFAVFVRGEGKASGTASTLCNELLTRLAGRF